MRILPASSVRIRLTLWYVSILALLLGLYIVLVFSFQYALLQRQIFHDEIQDVETVEGLLYFDVSRVLHLQQNYHSHASSHLLIDRLMEVRETTGVVLFRSETLGSQSLGGPNFTGEGNGTFNQRTETLADGTRVALISHIHPVQGHAVLIRLGYSLSPLYDRMRQFFTLLLIALPAALILAGFAGFSIAKRALEPLRTMAGRAEQITASNLHDRLEIQNPNDELGHIARVFNQLLQRLEESFEQLKRFTADAAHELRTPLASLRAVGEVALQDATKVEDYREAIGSILEETGRLNQTIEGLLLLAKAETSQPGEKRAEFFLPELIDEVLALLSVLLEERNITVVEERSGFENVTVRAERSLVRIALVNILHNALKFSPEGSTLKITSITERVTGDFAEVSVQDEGPGLAQDEYEKVFGRFFTSSREVTAEGSGTGLGLSIARLAIERNGGQIFFDKSSDSGAHCTIRLPLAPMN
jgi:signal transduction histidine kinase